MVKTELVTKYVYTSEENYRTSIKRGLLNYFLKTLLVAMYGATIENVDFKEDSATNAVVQYCQMRNIILNIYTIEVSFLK